jgi:hypothetical protein
MEVDPAQSIQADPAVDGDSAVLDQLSSTLDALSKKPYDYSLHERNLELSKALSMPDQVDSARALLAQHFSLPESGWLEWVEERKTTYKEKQEPEALVAVIELYERALQEILCTSNRSLNSSKC